MEEPAMPNLREELNDLIFKMAGGIKSNGKEEEDAILALIRQRLPKKGNSVIFRDIHDDYVLGFNEAISEIERSLDG